MKTQDLARYIIALGHKAIQFDVGHADREMLERESKQAYGELLAQCGGKPRVAAKEMALC